MKIGSPWRMHKQISWEKNREFWSLFSDFGATTVYSLSSSRLSRTNSQVNFRTLNGDVIKKTFGWKSFSRLQLRLMNVFLSSSSLLLLWINYPNWFEAFFPTKFESTRFNYDRNKINVLWIFHLCLWNASGFSVCFTCIAVAVVDVKESFFSMDTVEKMSIKYLFNATLCTQWRCYLVCFKSEPTWNSDNVVWACVSLGEEKCKQKEWQVQQVVWIVVW